MQAQPHAACCLLLRRPSCWLDATCCLVWLTGSAAAAAAAAAWCPAAARCCQVTLVWHLPAGPGAGARARGAPSAPAPVAPRTCSMASEGRHHSSTMRAMVTKPNISAMCARHHPAGERVMPAFANLRLYCDRVGYRRHPPAAAGPSQPARLLLCRLQPALLLRRRLPHAPHLLQQLAIISAGLLQRALQHVELRGRLGAVLPRCCLLPLCCLEGHLQLVPVAGQRGAGSVGLCRWLQGSWPCADCVSGLPAAQALVQEQVVTCCLMQGPCFVSY